MPVGCYAPATRKLTRGLYMHVSNFNSTSRTTEQTSRFLLHGSSAAFWQCAWWRSIVGFRWVRKDDPDGFSPSSHPIRPYLVKVAKSRHPLCQQLQDVAQPSDEIYINLEQSCPTTTLMTTTIEEGTFPMAYETITPWGGKIVSYLPGHAPAAVRQLGNVTNCRSIIEYLITPT